VESITALLPTGNVLVGFAFMIISLKAGMVTFWLRENLNKLGT
jgi:hypothetical protein